MGETTFIPDSAQTLNAFVTVVVILVGLAQLVFFYNLFKSAAKGKVAERNPWKACSLEWQTPEFPPGHGNFGDELPVVYRWAYDYGVPGAEDDFVPQNIPPDQVKMKPGATS